MDEESKTVNLGSVKELLKFIFSHKSDFFIIYPGIVALCLRITFNIEKHIFNTPLDTEYLLGISFGGSIIAFLIAPIIFMIYFVLVWVWKDAGIKIASINQKSQKESILINSFNETPEIKSAASEFKNLIGLVAGISTLTWIGQMIAEETVELSPEIAGLISFGVVLVVFIIFFSGAGLLMAVMYYRSGLHEEFVNNIQIYILEQNHDEIGEEKVYKIRIGSYKFHSSVRS